MNHQVACALRGSAASEEPRVGLARPAYVDGRVLGDDLVAALIPRCRWPYPEAEAGVRASSSETGSEARATFDAKSQATPPTISPSTSNVIDLCHAVSIVLQEEHEPPPKLSFPNLHFESDASHTH